VPFGVELIVGIVVVTLLITLVAARFTSSRSASDAWDAGFAKPDQTGLVAKASGPRAAAVGTGIYLGWSVDQPKGQKPLELGYTGDRHIMTFGPNGAGKSMRLLYENLIRLKGWSVVVVDPKGDLARLTLEKRRAMGSAIVVLDPFGVSGFASDGYNPIAALADDENLPDDALALAEAIIKSEGRDPHWGASAQDLVAACIMHIRLNEPDTGSFEDVRKIIGSDNARMQVNVVAMRKTAEAHEMPQLEAKAARYADINAESRELLSILSTALTQTRWLDSPPVVNDLKSEKRFRFGDLKEKPTTIYLVLPPNRIATHSAWLRLMVTSILQPLLKDTSPAKVPVLLMLDEYPALAEGDGFPIIARNMAMFRGYGVKLWSVWQDVNQAIRIYGRNWESFAANAGVLQAFQPQDIPTAEYLSQRTGLTTFETSNWSFSGRQPSFSGSQQGMPLMLPQAVRAMEEGHTLIFSHVANGPVRAYLPFPKL
jgi:type IV secretion system protein VirD4